MRSRRRRPTERSSLGAWWKKEGEGEQDDEPSRPRGLRLFGIGLLGILQGVVIAALLVGVVAAVLYVVLRVLSGLS